ncbi:MAG: trehalase family glycosidase [Kiloniellales bacterium]
MKPRGPGRDWGTWNPERPAELLELSSGFALTPLLYSARGNSVSALPPGDGFVYGPRSMDGASVAFEVAHEETRLAWRYDLSEPDTATIDWYTLANGEWGLRFWVLLCISGPDGMTLSYDRAKGRLRAGEGAAKLEVCAAKDPLLVTFHDDLDALAAELESKGYFYLASRGTSGRFAALRFNLEEAPAMRIVASLLGAARPSLPAQRNAQPSPTFPAAQESLQAIHDVVAWNRVYDRVNRRPYTVLTRAWNSRKFGGFGVWMTDILYSGMLWSLFDADKARHDIEAVFVWQTADGNFPCLVTGNDQWLDRTQLPVASYVLWLLHARSGDRALLEWAFPALLRNYDWWWRRRSLADTGLVAYGTSLDVGDGLYKGTKLAAKNESSMDNMAIHDPAPFDAERGLLLSADVAVNSLLALDGEVLALMAGALGLDVEQRRLSEQSERHKARIRDWLWDDERGVFANRLLSGAFVEPLAPTSFYPMVAGAATAEQCESLIARYLLAPDKFGGPLGLPSVTRDHPAYHDNVYWRGRIWAPLNFWAYQGLRRCGREAEATALAAMSYRLFEGGWRRRQCGENYNAESGAITDQADTEHFYAWGALLPALTVAEVVDVSPWDGCALAPSLARGELGPLRTSLGRLTIRAVSNAWQVLRDDQLLLSGNVEGRMTEVEEAPGGFTVRLPSCKAGCWLLFSGRSVEQASLDGAPLAVSGGHIELPACAAGAELGVRFAADGEEA